MTRVRLTLDRRSVDVLTKVDDVDRVRAGALCAITRQQVSEHPLADGGWLVINWRNIGITFVEPAPTP